MNTPVLPWLTLPLVTLAYGVSLSYLSQRLSRKFPGSSGLDRKLIHVGIFSGAVLPQLFLGFWGVVLYGSSFALLVLAAYRRGQASLLYRSLARATDGEEEGRLVLLPLGATAVGGLLGVLLVGNFATVGYLACGWGDAAGEMVGRRWGRRRYSNPFLREKTQRRSLEGSLGVFLFASLGAAVALGLMGYSPFQLAWTGVLAGLAASAAEGLSGRGTDNFWVQIVPSLLAWWVLG